MVWKCLPCRTLLQMKRPFLVQIKLPFQIGFTHICLRVLSICLLGDSGKNPKMTYSLTTTGRSKTRMKMAKKNCNEYFKKRRKILKPGLSTCGTIKEYRPENVINSWSWLLVNSSRVLWDDFEFRI